MKLRSVWKGAVLVTVSALLIAAVTVLGLLAFVWYNSDGGRDWIAPLWEISDTLNAMMALPNLIALLLLSGQVARATRDYFRPGTP